jgi:hypothetical protein
MTGRSWSHLLRLKRDALLAAVAAGAGPGARDAAQQQQGQGTLTTLWPVSAAAAAAQAHAHTQSHAAVLKAFHQVSGVCIRLTASSVRTVNCAQVRASSAYSLLLMSHQFLTRSQPLQLEALVNYLELWYNTVLVKTWIPREHVKEQNRTGKSCPRQPFCSRVKGPCLTTRHRNIP